MRKPLTTLTAALLFCMLTLMLAGASNPRTVKAAGPPPERCNECVAGVQARFEQCQTVLGQEELRCYDQYNEGIVQCYRNFCEQ